MERQSDRSKRPPEGSPLSRQEKKPAAQGEAEGGGESCRCKEVSKKSLPELFRMMLRDLAFWKK